ncbi:hypothetical protein H8959_003025 [Pygathrix nigripes]
MPTAFPRLRKISFDDAVIYLRGPQWTIKPSSPPPTPPLQGSSALTVRPSLRPASVPPAGRAGQGQGPGLWGRRGATLTCAMEALLSAAATSLRLQRHWGGLIPLPPTTRQLSSPGLRLPRLRS